MLRKLILLCVLCSSAVGGLGCSPGAPAEGPRIVDQRPELARVYEACLAVWQYFDGLEEDGYTKQARSVRAMVKLARPQFEARCPDAPAECQLNAYDHLMDTWKQESGYVERLMRLERMRTLLASMHSVLSSETPASPRDWVQYADELRSLIQVTIGELEAHGVRAPELVTVALGVITRFLKELS